MGRLACVGIALMLLLLLPQPALAAGPRANEFWDHNRLFEANYTSPPGTDIEIAAGVNISFDPPGYPMGDERIFFTLSDGLKVCGTANSTVSFYARNYVWFYYGESPACITVMGNGNPGQLDVRNCTFSSVVLDLNGTAGIVQDCTFVNCGVFVQNSVCEFLNCTFLTSTLTVLSVGTTNQTKIVNCSFDGGALLPEEVNWHYLPFSGIAVYGYASISGCALTRYYYGIASWAGLPSIRDTHAYSCLYGIGIYTEDPVENPVIANCTLEECNYSALSVSGNAVFENCTLRNSLTGLELYNMWGDTRPSWTLRGNSIYGNFAYGISVMRADVDPGDTRFDDGAGTGNALGRVQGLENVIYRVISPDGQEVEEYYLNRTSATGMRTDMRVSGRGVGELYIQAFVVDNSGARAELYPYTLRAEKDGRFNQTTLNRADRNVTLVLSVLADIIPAMITIEPKSPKGGQYVVFTLTVFNNGSQPTTQLGKRPKALFTLDGARLDEVDLFNTLPGNSTQAVALDWKARQGHHTLRVTLDADNKLPENDESNNNLTFEFDVAAAPPAPINFPIMQAVGVALLLLMVVGMVLWVRQSKRASPPDEEGGESSAEGDESPENKDAEKNAAKAAKNGAGKAAKQDAGKAAGKDAGDAEGKADGAGAGKL
jgi:hypothetical protein